MLEAGSGEHFEQCDNAQAAVGVDSQLIVGQRVSQAPNDKQELLPNVSAVLTDSAFFSEAAVRQIEQTPAGPPSGPTV